MPNGHAIELTDLPTMHPPIGAGMLHLFALPALIRLSVDPTPLAITTMCRKIAVEWKARDGTPAQTINRVIGWANLQNHFVDFDTRVAQLPHTLGPQPLTEFAAIAIMALLVSNLERMVLNEVLQIGSGGDYYGMIDLIRFECEVSGIRDAAFPSVAMARLREKTEQLLAHPIESGFVSVTTFAHPTTPPNGIIVHSFLHFVTRSATISGPASKKRKKKKGKKK